MRKIYINLFSIFVLCSIMFVSCSGRGNKLIESPIEETDQSNTEVIELKAKIVFYSGEVFHLQNGEWIEAEIGLEIANNESIKVGEDSSCEIEFSNLAIVRLDSNTTINIASYLSDGNSNQSTIDLEEGAVFCKVKKFVSNDAFEIQTDSTVCGVRGTEFIVRKDDANDNLLIAVNEGFVEIRPIELDLVALKEGSSDSETAEKVSMIQEELPVVIAGQEVTISLEDFNKIKEESSNIISNLDSVDDDELDTLLSGLQEIVRLDSESTKESITNISSAAKQEAAIFEAMTEIKSIDQMREEDEIKEFILEIETTPDNASIIINDVIAGAGNYGNSYPEGTELTIKVAADGYHSETIEWVSSDTSERLLLIELEVNEEEVVLNPFPFRYYVSNVSIKGDIDISNGVIYMTDSNGSVYAYSPQYGKIWSAATSNTTELVYAEVYGDIVLFSGASSLVALNKSNGAVILNMDNSVLDLQMFGERSLIYNGQIIHPQTNGTISFVDLASGSIVNQLDIPQSTNVSVSLYNNQLLTADKSGKLIIVDPVSASITGSIQSTAIQSVSAEPYVFGTNVILAGRKGDIACFNLASNSLAWQSSLGTKIFHNVTASASSIAIFAKNDSGQADNQIDILNWSGVKINTLFNVSAPPIYAEGYLIYGDNYGNVVLANPYNGATVKTQEIGSGMAISARPVALGNGLIALGVGGELVILDINELE